MLDSFLVNEFPVIMRFAWGFIQFYPHFFGMRGGGLHIQPCMPMLIFMCLCVVGVCMGKSVGFACDVP